MLQKAAPSLDKVVEEGAFRAALRLFASGVTVITSPDGQGGTHAMTVTAFSSLSLQPPLVLVAVARESRCHRLIPEAGRFGVSMLYDHQTEISRHFGKQGQAPRPPEFTTLDGVPVLAGAMTALACSLQEATEGGDHSIFVGLVTAAHARAGAPLVLFDGQYRSLRDIE